MAVRRQLMEALRTQDIADLEHAIADATAVLTESAAVAAGNTSSASSGSVVRGAQQRVVDLDGLLLESKKAFLRLMGHCKHLIKPLRRSVRALDGPGIVESLDCIYRSPPAVQKTIEKDTRHAERTVRLMSHAALDAKHMYHTQRWEDVDKFLNLYASVLREDVVMELTNIRDALLHVTSPNKEPLSPTSSPLSADTVSPSQSPRGRDGSVGSHRRVGHSDCGDSIDRRGDGNRLGHPTLVDASIVLSPMMTETAQPQPGQQREVEHRQRDTESALKERVVWYRNKLRETACSLAGQQAMMRRLTASMEDRSASDWSAPYFDSDHLHNDNVHNHRLSGSESVTYRRKYKFLCGHAPATSVGPREERRTHHAPEDNAAHANVPPHATAASDAPVRVEADARRQLYYSPSAATTTDSTATSVHHRSGAPSPTHSHRGGSIAALLLQSATTSASTSAAASRSSSPTPYHPTGTLHHERPPLSHRQVGSIAQAPPPILTLAAQLASEVAGDESSSRHFIEESEAFNRGVELNPQQARLRLVARTRTQYRVLMTASDESPRSGHQTMPPQQPIPAQTTPHDGLVHLGRWGMNRDPYTSVDRSPERVENAPGTMRHHEEVLSLKSPSPPNASDE